MENISIIDKLNKVWYYFGSQSYYFSFGYLAYQKFHNSQVNVTNQMMPTSYSQV